MTIYVYRRRPSDGGKLLAEALETVVPGRVLKVREFPSWRYRFIKNVVCWGEQLPPELAGVRALNNAPPMSKLAELQALTEAGVPTVTWSRTKVEDYLPRRSDHHGGLDLLHPGRADYWVEKEELVKEYRLHVFKVGDEYVSIRAGRKEPRVETPHPWIRSYEGGWHIVYDGRGVKDSHRDIAKRAVEALGLSFAAVDIGQTAEGALIVLECNRAPGLEGRTVEIYAQYIKQWLEADNG